MRTCFLVGFYRVSHMIYRQPAKRDQQKMRCKVQTAKH